jgi:hypothetical protein
MKLLRLSAWETSSLRHAITNEIERYERTDNYAYVKRT